MTVHPFHTLNRFHGLLLYVAGSAFMGVHAQTNATVAADSQTHQVRGQVTNALDGSPLPRALVTLNARSTLTDDQGRFEFAGFVGGNVFASVRKPGFSAHADASGDNTAQPIADLDASVLLKLYPDAVVSGILTGRDGAALSQVQVRLFRSQFDGIVTRWLLAGSTQTNTRGEYRISTPTGRYRLVSSFIQRSFETGETILPASFPQFSQGSTSTFLELRSGQEKRVDLHARVGSVYPVILHMEPTTSQRMNPRVIISTSAGDEFSIGLSSDEQLELPVGTYALRVQGDGPEDALSGFSLVTVTGPGTPPVPVHLAPEAQFSVELLPGTLAASSQTSNSHTVSNMQELPNVQQFNFLLHNQMASGETQSQDIRLRPASDKSVSFRVPPGRYRLTASGGGAWHVESATVGATDLLSNDLVVGAGSAGGTLRLLVSNQTGTVHARTHLPQNASAWMYLIPRGPSLTPIQPISLSGDSAGMAIATTSVPPGAYTAVLLETHLQEDPRDPAFLASFVSGATDIEVQPSADTSFSLEPAKRKQVDR